MGRYTAVVLSAGSGKRMGSTTPKQYLKVLGRPLLAYTLMAFEESRVDEVVLVVSEEYREYCIQDIIHTYGIHKVHTIVNGGRERYDSVYAGLEASEGDYVLIHDGARAMITPQIINTCIDEITQKGSCVVGMPVKDTIKIVDGNGMIQDTPDRSRLWQVQTPQCFPLSMIQSAYKAYIESGKQSATDDAMILQEETDEAVHLIEGSYSNIKVTTPDDLTMAEAILKSNGWKAEDRETFC